MRRYVPDLLSTLRSKNGLRLSEWLNGEYMIMTRHNVHIAVCGCRLQDTTVGRVQMQEVSQTSVRHAEQK